MTLPNAYRPSEKGAALLTALVMIVVLAGVVVAVLDDIRFAVRRTLNMRLHDQALWYAKGAEDLGRQIIRRSWQAQPARSTLNDPWAQEGVRFPIDGGVIAGRIRDGGNCFNLNSVVARDARGRWTARPEGMEQFANLLTAVQINATDAEALAAAAADWIDSDGSALPGGAEDSDYMRREPPYRTAGVLMGDATELRAVRGVTEKIYAAVRPFVCALPTPNPSVLNVNTLLPDQAPLLVMIAAPGLSLNNARRAIEARPLSGYTNLDAFWAQDELAAFKPSDAVSGQTALVTRYYLLDTEVRYHAAEVVTGSLVELDAAGNTALLTRRIGGFE
jgi:general secretion pathway protein K